MHNTGFLNLTETLVEAFNEGKVPVLEQAAESVAKKACEEAVNEAIEIYEKVSLLLHSYKMKSMRKNAACYD